MRHFLFSMVLLSLGSEVQMKRLLTLVYVCLFVAGCSTAQPNSAATEKAVNAIASPDQTVSGPPATINPPSSYSLLAVTANPPNLPADSGGRSGPAGWRSFTSATLGVAVDYPSDWSAIEQADGVTFTSPQDAKVHLQAIKINGNNTDAENKSQQCATLINSYGLSVDACVDTGTSTYSTRVSLQSNNGSTQQLLLSTTSIDALDVYRQMLDSLRPTQ